MTSIYEIIQGKNTMTTHQENEVINLALSEVGTLNIMSQVLMDKLPLEEQLHTLDKKLNTK